MFPVTDGCRNSFKFNTYLHKQYLFCIIFFTHEHMYLCVYVYFFVKCNVREICCKKVNPIFGCLSELGLLSLVLTFLQVWCIIVSVCMGLCVCVCLSVLF